MEKSFAQQKQQFKVNLKMVLCRNWVPTNKHDLDVLFGTGYADDKKIPLAALFQAFLNIFKKFILLGMPDKQIGE